MISGDTQWFQIWDTSNNISAYYFRGAAGVQTPGLPKLGRLASVLTSGGFTASGPWNTLPVSQTVNVSDFNGLALMLAAAPGALAGTAVGRSTTTSDVSFQLQTMSKNGNQQIDIPRFNTGDTNQILPSAAGTLGPFVIVIWAGLLKGGNGGVFPFSG